MTKASAPAALALAGFTSVAPLSFASLGSDPQHTISAPVSRPTLERSSSWRRRCTVGIRRLLGEVVAKNDFCCVQRRSGPLCGRRRLGGGCLLQRTVSGGR